MVNLEAVKALREGAVSGEAVEVIVVVEEEVAVISAVVVEAAVDLAMGEIEEAVEVSGEVADLVTVAGSENLLMVKEIAVDSDDHLMVKEAVVGEVLGNHLTEKVAVAVGEVLIAGDAEVDSIRALISPQKTRRLHLTNR